MTCGIQKFYCDRHDTPEGQLGQRQQATVLCGWDQEELMAQHDAMHQSSCETMCKWGQRRCSQMK